MQEKEERVSIEERIGVVLADGAGRNAVRLVTALGIVGITELLAHAVFRLKYSNDAKSYPQVLADIGNLARRLNVRRNWRMRRGHLDEMSKAVLDYWLSDTCPVCEGRAWGVAAGTPYLNDQACQSCLERPGKRPYPWRLLKPKIKIRERDRPERKRELIKRRRQYDAHIERYEELLCELEAAERRAGERVIKALAIDVREINRLVAEGETEIDRSC